MTHHECISLLATVRTRLEKAAADARLARDIAREAVERIDAAMSELAAAERRHRLGPLADAVLPGDDEETALCDLTGEVLAADRAVAVAADRCEATGCPKSGCPFLAAALARAATTRRVLGEYLAGQHLAEPDRAQTVADDLVARAEVWAP
jgi:hypothetical protein